MATHEPMRCPNCGRTMNHHADKVDYSAALDDAAVVDPVLGGVLEEVHTCPGCGESALRPAEV